MSLSTHSKNAIWIIFFTVEDKILYLIRMVILFNFSLPDGNRPPKRIVISQNWSSPTSISHMSLIIMYLSRNFVYFIFVLWDNYFSHGFFINCSQHSCFPEDEQSLSLKCRFWIKNVVKNPKTYGHICLLAIEKNLCDPWVMSMNPTLFLWM